MNNEIYRQEILDHFKNPRNFGELKNPDKSGRAVNTLCGDEIELSIKLADSGSGLADVKFKGSGCAISQASASLLTERVKGMKVAEIKSLTGEDVQKNLGIKLSPTRLKCALLPLEALHRAVFDEGSGNG